MPTCSVRGVELHYQWHGDPAAAVLVLNNGIMMTTASWARQLPAFARHFRVLAYDMRGQGQSSHPPGPYSMGAHADDLAALLDALEVDRAHVLGISYGGEVAQAFALRHQARVRSLVLADTVSEVGPELRLAVESWRRAALGGDPDALFELSVPWNFSPAFVAANPALFDDARRRYRDLDLAALAALCDAFQDVHFTPQLAEVTVPACVLVGELDILKGPAYARRLQAAIAGAELHVVQGAGHAACWEKPDEFNTVVLGFLVKHA